MKETLQQLVLKGDFFPALALLDELVETDNAAYLLRSLVRERVSDLAAALRDVEAYDGKGSYLCLATRARLLAKLGYVDKAQRLFESVDFEQHLRFTDEDGIPWSHGVVYQEFDLFRLGFRADIASSVHTLAHIPEPLHNAVKYALESTGQFSVLERIDPGYKDQTLRELAAVDTLPRGEVLWSAGLAMHKELDGIRGWLTPCEAALLYMLSQQVAKQHNIVELGSFYGRSGVSLGMGSKMGQGPKIAAIDPHEGILAYGAEGSFLELKKSIQRFDLESQIDIVRAASLEAAVSWQNGGIGLLFIDALHDYENVKADFESWSEYVVEGGFVAFHDAVQPGVYQFLRELLEKEDTCWEPLGLRNSLFVLKRLPSALEKRTWFCHYLGEKADDHLSWLARMQSISEKSISMALSGFADLV